MYTIYSYWDMAEIQSVLNAVVNVMGGGDYLGLLRTFALVGLFIAVGYGFVRARAEDGGAYLLILALWYVGLFVPKVTVVVEDRAPATGAPVSIANVPLGLAFFTATTSHIGAFLTERYETMFSLPSELRFDQSGLMFGSRVLEEMRRSSVADATLSQDITMFVRNCLNPELLNSPALMDTLVSSTDIWKMIKDGASGTMFNPGLAVTVYVPSAGASQWVNCKDVVAGGGSLAAPDSLDARIAATITKEQNRLAALLNPGLSVASAKTIVAAQIVASDALMLGTSRSAQEAIRQNVMINLMRDTSKTIPQLLNDPGAIQIAVGESIAAASSNSSYLVMAKMAEGTLPKIRNIIQLIVISVFPIVMVLIIMAGTKGGLVLRSYAMAMFWVQLWAALYAVLNYISTMAAAKSAQGAIASAGGQSLGNAADLASTVLSDQAIAGIMTISVPIIALALVKGGEVAMSGVVSSVMGPGASTAQRAGDTVGQGNIGIGNTSWGTHTANMTSMNKSDVNSSYNTGMTSRGDGLVQYNADSHGSMAMDASRLASSFGAVGGKLSNAVGQSAATQATKSWNMGLDYGQSFSTSLSASIAHAKDFVQSSGGSTGFRSGTTTSWAFRLAEAGGRMESVANDLAQTSGVDRSVAASVMAQASLAARAGADLGVWAANMEGRLTAGGTKQDVAKDLVHSAAKFAASSDYRQAFDEAQSAIRDGAQTAESSAATRAGASTQAQLNATSKAAEDSSANFRKAQAFDHVSREMASGDRSVDASLASLYFERNGAQASESLARGDILQGAASLQGFADAVAEKEAANFLSHGGAAPISDAQKAVVGEVEARAPSSAGALPGNARVMSDHQKHLAEVPGSATAAPRDVRPAHLPNAEELELAVERGLSGNEASNTAGKTQMDGLYHKRMDEANNPLTLLGSANAFSSLMTTFGTGAMIKDAVETVAGQPASERAPNDNSSWRNPPPSGPAP